jgi:hypothetical protein
MSRGLLPLRLAQPERVILRKEHSALPTASSGSSTHQTKQKRVEVLSFVTLTAIIDFRILPAGDGGAFGSRFEASPPGTGIARRPVQS